jgi:hypothetical protein
MNTVGLSTVILTAFLLLEHIPVGKTRALAA